MANPNLLTAQQHRFVLAILAGETQAEAYKAARFPTPGNQQLKEIGKSQANKKAAELMKAAPVRDALAQAQARSLDLAATNLASLVADLQEARNVALHGEFPQANAAVAATMGIAKLLGLAVDRAQIEHVVHKPGFSSKALELSEDDWKRQFASNTQGPPTGKAVGKAGRP